MANSDFKFPDEVEEQKAQSQEQDIEISVQADDDVEIDIVDDTPDKDKGRRPLDREVSDPTDEELDTYTEGVKKRLKELTHARHDERRAKEALAREKQELERLALAMIEENKRLKQHVQTGTEQFKTMAQEAAEAKLKEARQTLKAAQEAYDTDAIIAAQEALAEATWEVKNAKNFTPPPLQTREEEVQIQQPQSQQVRPDEKTLRWQAKNQWFGAQGFEEVTSYALGLHQKLVNSGVDPRSDEYYEKINSRMRQVFPEQFSEEEETEEPEPPRRKSPVVAPATRSTAPKKVTLTKTQVALAKRLGLPLEVYAKQVAEDMRKQNG